MSTNQTIALPAVDELRLTIVTDNTIDPTLPDALIAKRLTPPAEINLDMQPPVAEHGFSVLLNVHRGEHSAQVLFDTGISKRGFLHNLDALEIRPRSCKPLSSATDTPTTLPACWDWLTASETTICR